MRSVLNSSLEEQGNPSAFHRRFGKETAFFLRREERIPADRKRYFSPFGINGKSSHIFGTKNDFGGLAMQDYIERRVLEISNYMLESKGTVRQTASVFGISKSTVHMAVIKKNGSSGI